MSARETFRFTGRDSLAQLHVVFVVLFGGGCPSILMILWGYGATLMLVLIPLSLTIAVGLRSSIVVSDCGVTISRLWFFIPFWKHTGKSIEDVWFGGNWGLDDDAMGVVLKVDGKELHIGSRQTMHFLYDALNPYRRIEPDTPAESRHDTPSAEVSE